MLLSESSGPLIVEVPGAAEANRQIMHEQVVVKTLSAGQIEVGLGRTRLSQFDYSPGGVIVCRRDTEEWVRWQNPMRMLLVPISQHSLSIAAEECGIRENVVATPKLLDPRALALLSAIQAEAETGFQGGTIFLESSILALAAALLTASGSE